MNYEYTTEHVHKSQIKPGDVIVCSDGRHRTLCKADFSRDDLLGITIRGDSYMAGYEPVERVKIKHAKPEVVH